MLKKRHSEKQRILLVNITRLGDMLQATPTIAGMKLENPDAHITVLVEKQFESICHILPGIDEVVSVDLGMTVRSLAREQEGIIDAFDYVGELVEKLRKGNYDYCLNMSSSAYTALLLKLVGVPHQGGWSSDDEGYRVIESDWAKLFATSVFHQNRQYNSLNLVDVFRCSADVDLHPRKLQIGVGEENRDYCRTLLAEAKFTNTGPLIAIQAGASQEKRQWAPRRFIALVRQLIDKHNARIVMTGTKKELSIIDPICKGVNSPNVFVAAGRTNIPQLSALLEMSDILVTGDTGPMHMSVAVGTPVVSMFLASAFGFETGPYSEGNIIIQPIIGCGPCNPNKGCSRPDCHDTIEPEWLAELTMMRLKEDFTSLPQGFVDQTRMVVFRSCFDELGFCDLQPLSPVPDPELERFRSTYRRLWLDDIGGYSFEQSSNPPRQSALSMLSQSIEGLERVQQMAGQAAEYAGQLMRVIADPTLPAAQLGEINNKMLDMDRGIEELGFQHPPLGPLTRMFVFGKENLSGTGPLELASQMKSVYQDLYRRCVKFASYYNSLR